MIICWVHQINLIVGDCLAIQWSVMDDINHALDVVNWFNNHGTALWSSSPSHHLLVTSGTSHAKSLIFLIGLDNQLLFTRGTFPLDHLQISAKLAKI